MGSIWPNGLKQGHSLAWLVQKCKDEKTPNFSDVTRIITISRATPPHRVERYEEQLRIRSLASGRKKRKKITENGISTAFEH